ncbi:(d)CMP kinase [Plebeiibacterium sediminum]|uniref:Cytidylate kinase n=1 Tax=Plebeiibacterium sediminum TaxID=2992112 RepID=A0AAE3M6S4_9BACT|nr:(d)CMP kinase [Plebeiobacterium sediminum]MCW3788046.1 (d)CMP kinase [Plebeiobacterium sediminum]
MTIKKSKLVIAIDGYSSCGKSTVAKDLAKLLNIIFIDSGAMYRCVTLYALENGMINSDKIDEDKLKSALNNISISFKFEAATKTNETYLNGELVESKIRSLEVSSHVSSISAIGFVRKKMVELQQKMGETESIVMDGRDIGTVVFPNADLKLFMTASPEIRAERRFKEFQEKNENISFDEVLENVKSRDHIDETREESPLKKADDAVVLDNGKIGKEEQLNFIVEELKKRDLIQ